MKGIQRLTYLTTSVLVLAAHVRERFRIVHWKSARSAAASPSLERLEPRDQPSTVCDFDVACSPYNLAQFNNAPPPTIIAGCQTGNCLRVAHGDTPTPNHGAIGFDLTDPGLFGTIEVKFEFKMDPVNGKADGLGFALLNTIYYGASGANAPLDVAEEPNFVGSIGIGFDIWASFNDPNDNHVSLHFGSEVAEFPIDKSKLNLAPEPDGQWIEATITLQPNAGFSNVTVILDPTVGDTLTVVDHYVVSGFVPYEGRPWWGGRSGGESAHHDIDEIDVQYKDPITGPCTNPATCGQFGPLLSLPVVPIHAHNLPNGNVLLWDRHETGTDGNPYLWDLENGSFTKTPMLPYDLFCSGHAFMPDGRLFVAGGHQDDGVGVKNTSTYDGVTNGWTPVPDMNAGRWYPSVTTLSNGDMLVMAGTIDQGVVNAIPQVFQTATGTWRDLTTAQLASFPEDADFYPYNFVAPNGQIFVAGPQQTARYLDLTGTGKWITVADSSMLYRDYGTGLMYEPGKVIIAGGKFRDETSPVSSSAEVIDLTVATPTWSQTSPMTAPRRFHTGIILSDGTVFVAGGTSAPKFDDPTGAVLHSESWDPATGKWTRWADYGFYMGYHSNVLLLPDGRVLLTSGGHPPFGVQPQAQVFSPPYLFKGPRPTITFAPSFAGYNKTIFVQTPNAGSIQQVTLVRLGSVTHGFDQNQRFNELEFTVTAGVLNVQTPNNANLAPPGHYMLFIIDQNGVPSLSRIVQIGVGPPAVKEIAWAVGGAHGLVQIRLGLNATALGTFSPYPGYTGPVTVALGDIDRDGFRDLVTGAAVGNPHVKVFKGVNIFTGLFDPGNPDASLLAQWFAYALQFNVGANVAVGDVNHDGYSDIVTGATIGNPHVKVYEGQDIASGTFDPAEESILASWFAYGVNFNVGVNVGLGDFDNDGFADVTAGALPGNPHVKVYAGRDIGMGIFDPTTSVRASFFPFAIGFNVGAFVAGGDINDDEFPDLIVGSSRGNPNIRAYSGKAIANGTINNNPDAAKITEFFAYALDNDVGVTVGAADFEQTGKSLIVTGNTKLPPRIRMYRDTAMGVEPQPVFEASPWQAPEGIYVGAGA